MPLSDDDLAALSPDHLLVLVIEEAGEVIQAAMKMMRFGALNHHPDRESINVVELCREVEQLGATGRILGSKFGLNYRDTVAARHEAARAQTRLPCGCETAGATVGERCPVHGAP